jgi:hypothetical protein
VQFFFPYSSYFIYFGSKCSPQHSVLRQPPSVWFP